MTRSTLRLVVLLVLLTPGLAGAQASIGLRTGYAIPGGSAYEQSGLGTFSQRQLATGMIPIQLDAGWRFGGALSMGLYFAYGVGRTGTKLNELCSTPGASCERPRVIRYGAAAAYGFGQVGPVEPWLGLSAGIESASFKVKNFVYGVNPGPPPTPRSADLDGTLRGWETQLEGGADYRVGSSLRVGPLLSLGMGQYRVQDIKLSDQGTVAGGGVDTAKTHTWLTLGVRGRFDL
jgi:hypothetical protein